jgi:hypothetical protein
VVKIEMFIYLFENPFIMVTYYPGRSFLLTDNEENFEESKIEVLKINNGIIPPEIREKVKIPIIDLKKGEPILKPFMSKELANPDLDLIIADFFKLYEITEGHPCYVWYEHGCTILGAHLGDYCSADERSLTSSIEKAYGIKIKDAIAIPSWNINVYWTLAHELLHSVFHSFKDETKQKLVQVAARSLKKMSNFRQVVEIYGYPAEYRDLINKQIIELSRKNKSTKHLEIFSNLESEDKTNLVDEYISYLLTDTDNYKIWENPVFFPVEFRKMLTELGYKVEHPPKLKTKANSRAIGFYD